MGINYPVWVKPVPILGINKTGRCSTDAGETEIENVFIVIHNTIPAQEYNLLPPVQFSSHYIINSLNDEINKE